MNNNKFNFKTKVDAAIIAKPSFGDNLKLKGVFNYILIRKDGTVEKWSSENNLPNAGLSYVLDLIFLNAGQFATWYAGIFTAISGSLQDLTGADIGGNLTEFTGYSGNRPAYVGVRTNQTISNTLSLADFPITGAGTIKGAFLASDDSGAASILLSVDNFTSGDRIVGIGDTLRVTYDITSGN